MGSARLHLGVNDVPKFSTALMFGFQQAMLCVSGLLVYPFLVSQAVCAGDVTVQLRVQLISATFVACGIATIAQTTFGLRLPILHGPAIAFLPPLLAYRDQQFCPYTEGDTVNEHEWMLRLQEISGSLLVACCTFLVIGGSGLAGVLSRLIGPVTICPLMILLAISIAPTMEEKLSLHWISILTLITVVVMAIYLENLRVPFYYYSRKDGWKRTHVRVFGQFPYLLSILLVWFICFLMTVTNLEPPGGEARTDKNASLMVLRESQWFHVPYPGQFGSPRLNLGLCLGYVASCLASVMENLGSYDLLARVSHQRTPPKHAVNRAIIVEGVGSMLAASMGVSTGVTTYSENIALVHITRVASRTTMQLAGLLLVLLGLFTKCAALLASIPDAMVGGILSMGVSMIAGVTLSNLQMVDLKLTRNLSIMGIALMMGIVIPDHFRRVPIHTGNADWDQVLNMLCSIKMLVGGIVAAFLDNTVSGASREQRGLETSCEEDNLGYDDEDDGYAFPSWVNRLLSYVPCLSYLPFLPGQNSSKRLPSSQMSNASSDR